MKFRKKPVVIEAIQWNGNNLYDIASFMEIDHKELDYNYFDKIFIKTLERTITVTTGDWIIKDFNRSEFYTCKPDIFEATYEKAE